MPCKKIEEFKDVHLGDTAVVFGSGPSIKKYDGRFNDGAVLLGTNEIVYYDTVMDYYFIGDAGDRRRGYLSDPDTYNLYRPRLAKFIRRPDKNARLQPSVVPQTLPDVIYYEGAQKTGFRFYDTIPPFSDALSITFDVLQFVLMAGFKKVYLIGQDCNYDKGSFKTPIVDSGTIIHANFIMQSWGMFSQVVSKRYPDVEIINVNPVRMRYFDMLETE